MNPCEVTVHAQKKKKKKNVDVAKCGMQTVTKKKLIRTNILLKIINNNCGYQILMLAIVFGSQSIYMWDNAQSYR